MKRTFEIETESDFSDSQICKALFIGAIHVTCIREVPDQAEILEALKPFSELYLACHHMHKDSPGRIVYGMNHKTISLGELRAAHETYESLRK